MIKLNVANKVPQLQSVQDFSFTVDSFKHNQQIPEMNFSFEFSGGLFNEEKKKNQSLQTLETFQ